MLRSPHDRPGRASTIVDQSLTTAVRNESLYRLIWRTPFLRGACLALFISGIGVSSTLPQMTLYLVDVMHLRISIAGLYYLVNVMAPISGFVVGHLSERIPNRLVLFRISALCGGIGWVAMSMATRPWMPFVIGAVVLGLGGGAMGQLFAAARDELSRNPTPANNRVIAAIRMCFSAGWIVGPVLGSWFGAQFGLRPLLIATAICAFGQVIPLGTRRVERFVHVEHDTESTPTTRNTRRGVVPLLVFLGCCVLLMNGDTMKFAYLPLYMANQLHTSDTVRGAVIAIQPFLELLLMPVFARIADRTSPMRVVSMAALFGIGAHLAYAISTNVTGLLVGQILMSGLWAAIAGLGITIAHQLHPGKVGLASSMYTSSLPLASAIGGALGALGVSWLGIPHLFFIPAALSVLGFVGLLITDRRYRPDDTAFAGLPDDLVPNRESP